MYSLCNRCEFKILFSIVYLMGLYCVHLPDLPFLIHLYYVASIFLMITKYFIYGLPSFKKLFI